MEELKPCPFCGSTDVIIECTHAIECTIERQLGWVECMQCGAQGSVIEVVGDQVGTNILHDSRVSN